MKRVLATVTALALGLVAGAASAQDYPWKPDRPVTIIVPWAAGGSTDQMARIVAAELEQALGQKFVVVNQPGASGSVGTKNALEATKDGYTWAAGAAVDVGTYKVLGLLDTELKDWKTFFAVANVTAIAAHPSAPFKDFGAFLDELKRDGDNVPVATAGLSSAGHNMMESIRAATPIKYKHVTYNGGAPAVIATVAGETKAVSQLLVEMSEHIKGKRLVPLAVMAEKPVMLEGYGEIPATAKWLPKMPAPMNYFGIWVHKDAPPAVIRTMEMVWKNKMTKSEALQKYAAARSAIFAPLFGDEAQIEAFKMVRYTAWLYFDAGKAKVSPDTLGIQRLQWEVRPASRPAAQLVVIGKVVHRMPETPPPSVMPHEEPLPPRHDLWTAAVFFCVGVAIIYLCWLMPTYREQQGQIYVAPGLVPALHGIVITGLSVWLGLRALSRGALRTAAGEHPKPREGYSNLRLFLATAMCLVFAVGLVGRLPFWLAAAIFVFAFTTLFEWQPGASVRDRVRRLAIAAILGAGTGGLVTLVFERFFLVRLP